MVRFKPNMLPAVAVLSADAKLHQELERTKADVIMPDSVRELVGRILSERPTVPVTLHLNADNPTIQQMAANRASDPEIYQTAIHAIHNNAILLTQQLMTPDDAQVVFNTSNHSIKLMVDQTEQLRELQGKLSAVQLALREKEKVEVTTSEQNGRMKHIVCMVAVPFRDSQSFAYETALLPALRDVLEQAPYYWQVVRADEKYFEDTIDRNVATWMKRSHAYIADISDVNPNVMMELGYMRWAREPWQPVIVLERAHTGALLDPADLRGIIRMHYPAASGRHAADEIAEVLKEEFAKDESIQKLNRLKQQHYLSPLLLRDRFRVSEDIARDLAGAYVTMESFVAANADDIRLRVSGLPRYMASGLQQEVVDLL